MPAGETRKERYNSLFSQLELVKAGFVGHWRDISDYIQPRRSRFFVTDANKGDRRNRNIIDSTATQCSETLEAGMMSGLTSPSRRWFDLTLPDKDLAQYGPVKEWLYKESLATSAMFSQSNIYQELPSVYGDCGDFATGCILIEEDFDKVMRALCIPIGSYMLAMSYRMVVDVFVRQYTLTVRQIVEQFGQGGWANISRTVKQMWDDGNYEIAIIVRHVITPNELYNQKALGAKYKKFSSCYYEMNGEGDQLLRESGYDFFPVMAPRWKTTGEDIYGTKCPGMVVLGDVKALQLMQKKMAQAVEKVIDPPIQGPTSLSNLPTSILPGAYNTVDAQALREGGMKPVHEVRPDIAAMVMSIQDIRTLIRGGYKTDLFRALLDTDRRVMTAREVEERHQEKISELSPVMERFNVDLLDPLVSLGFQLRVRQGRVSPPPQEIQGMVLGVQYISIMAQAQKALGIAGMDRFIGIVTTLAPLDQGTFDYVDNREFLAAYGDMVSLPPHIIRDKDAVKAIQQQRLQAQQKQQAIQNAQQMAQAGKNLAGTDMGGDNALTRLISDAQAGSRQPQLGQAG